MREITIYSIGERKQTVAGSFLRITEARAQGLLAPIGPHTTLKQLNAVEYTVHDLPIFTVVDKTGGEHYFAGMPELWGKLQCAVQGELEQVRALLAATQSDRGAYIVRLQRFYALPLWCRLVAAWKGEV